MSPSEIDGVAWVDGIAVPPSEASIPLMSAAVFRGTSVFDVMSVVKAGDALCAVGLVPHLERLLSSAAAMGMVPPSDLDTLTHAVRTVVADRAEPAIVRTVIADAGSSGAGNPARLVVAMTAEDAGPRSNRPLSMTSAQAKIASTVMPPHVKVAASYAPGLRIEAGIRRDARVAGSGSGGDGIINFTPDGCLLEAVSASVGVFIDGALTLPPLDVVLDSITRRLVLDVCDHLQIPVHIEMISKAAALDADEMFVASSTRFVVPVVELDGVRIGAHRATGGADVTSSNAEGLVGGLIRGIDAVLTGEHALSARWLTPVG